MTKEERKRALRLEKTIRTYSKYGVMNKGIIISSAFVLLIDMFLLGIGIYDVIMPFHVLMVSFLLGLLSSIPSTVIDTSGTLNNVDTARLKLGGSTVASDFISILPFNAKDLVNLKFLSFKKQLVFTVVLTVFVEIMITFAGCKDGTAHYEVSLLSTACLLIGQVFMMIMSFAQNKALVIIYCTLSMVVPFYATIYWTGMVEDTIARKAGNVTVFTGIAEIIIFIMLSALIVFAGEKYLKSIKNVSWHLK